MHDRYETRQDLVELFPSLSQAEVDEDDPTVQGFLLDSYFDSINDKEVRITLGKLNVANWTNSVMNAVI